MTLEEKKKLSPYLLKMEPINFTPIFGPRDLCFMMSTKTMASIMDRYVHDIDHCSKLLSRVIINDYTVFV